MAKRGRLVASVILIGFAIRGELLLDSLGISLSALRTACELPRCYQNQFVAGVSPLFLIFLHSL